MLLILFLDHIAYYRVLQQVLKLRTNCLGGLYTVLRKCTASSCCWLTCKEESRSGLRMMIVVTLPSAPLISISRHVHP